MSDTKETNNHNKKWSAELNEEFSILNDWEAPKEMFNMGGFRGGDMKRSNIWNVNKENIQ